MKPIVIGFLGRAGSGKTTCTNYLCSTFKAKAFSFAKPLKELTKVVFDFKDDQVFGTQLQKECVDLRYGFSPRTAMIRLGDGIRNILGKQTWLDACLKQIPDVHATNPAPFYIIEDVRYPNEAEAIAKSKVFNGYVVKLICPDSDSSLDYANAPSEKGVDDCDPEHICATITAIKSPDALGLKIDLNAVICHILAANAGAVRG